jgi:hypothetical protein
MRNEYYNSHEKFDRLFRNISNPIFQNKSSLAGEIPFYVFPYPPDMEIQVNKEIHALAAKLGQADIKVEIINLYDLSINILKNKGYLDAVIKAEPAMRKDIFLDNLKKPLDANSVIADEVKKIAKNVEHEVIFITGVGTVFPFIRSHNVLNNLQSVITQTPLILFFPGIYNGFSLELFEIINDGNYYRAFNIDNLEI